MKKIYILLSLVNMMSVLLTSLDYPQAYNPQPAVAPSNDSQPLPATIQDPILLQAWVYLYSQDQSFLMWDGSSMSGRKLAQMVLDRRIVIAWDPLHICAYFSCSPRIDWDIAPIHWLNLPIFLSPSLKDPANANMDMLAGLMAHELYHHSLPFGSVPDTLFEEYWAYFVQNRIFNKDWAMEVHHDPLNPFCLQQWFKDHRYSAYEDEDLYPKAVDSLVEQSVEYCP